MGAGGFRFPCSGHYLDAHWHHSPSQCRRPRGGGADLCGDTQQRASADDLGSGLPSALGEAATAARAKYRPAGSAAAAAGGRRGTVTTVPSPLLCSPCSEAATPLVLAIAVVVLLAFRPGKGGIGDFDQLLMAGVAIQSTRCQVSRRSRSQGVSTMNLCKVSRRPRCRGVQESGR
jgi:hypothetical protein